MTYLKIGAVFLLIIFVIGGAFYLGVLEAVTGLVSTSNDGFIAYLPQEAVWIISLIFFSLLIGLSYSFFRE